MTAPTITLEATLQPDGVTIRLGEKVALPPGPVVVTVRPAGVPSGPTMLEVLDRIHREQAARGYQGRTKEEIDADLAALREEWEERLRGLEASREEGRRGSPGC